MIAFDNTRSIAEKVKFGMEQKLGGIMVWSIDTDDFQGDCGTENFPLMRGINKAIEESLQQIMDEENVIEQNTETEKPDKKDDGGTASYNSLDKYVFTLVLLGIVSYLY